MSAVFLSLLWLIFSAHQFHTCQLVWKKEEETNIFQISPLGLFCTRVRLYIWVPAPDDVRTGDDPKPTAQRVPPRGRLCGVSPLPLPTWHLPAWGSLREPFREASASEHGGRIWLIPTGTGWTRRRKEACTFTCLKITFPVGLGSHRGACLFQTCRFTVIDARQELWLGCKT